MEESSLHFLPSVKHFLSSQFKHEQVCICNSFSRCHAALHCGPAQSLSARFSDAFWPSLTNTDKPTHTHCAPILTNERWLHAQTVTPEVRAAVWDGAVAEQVAVANGVQVRHRAQVVSARAAASSPLAVWAKWVPDSTNMERTGKLPLGPPWQDPVCSAVPHHQEQQRHHEQDELHDESVKERHLRSFFRSAIKTMDRLSGKIFVEVGPFS